MSETTDAPERWLPVVEYEDLYAVSDHGRVRMIALRPDIPVEDLLLDERTTPKGYKIVHWRHDGKTIQKRVHRLVLEAFVSPCPPGQQCRHRNGDAGDNRLSNLKWGTQAENEADKVLHGTQWQAKISHCTSDHRLVAPNLIKWLARQGQRKCQACYLARQRVLYAKKSGLPELDFRSVADEAYAEIMNGTQRQRRSPGKAVDRRCIRPVSDPCADDMINDHASDLRGGAPGGIRTHTGRM